MKYSLLFAFVLVLTFSSASHAQSFPPWVETTGPSNVKCFAASGDTIFVGNATGVYLSPDNGTTWISDGLDSAAVFALVVFDGKVFAGTSGSGLFVSTNSGLNWTPDTNGFNGATEVSFLTVCGPNLIAASSIGICISTDGGVSWTQEVSVPYATLATDGTNVYATSFAKPGVYVSNDRGASWTVVISNMSEISSLAVLDGDIFAAGGSGAGVLRSTNGGVDWEQVNNGAFDSLLRPEFNCHFLLVYGQNLFVGTTFGIFLSTDTGAFWSLETDTIETQPGSGYFFDNTLLVWNGKLFAGAGTLQGLVPGADDSIWVCPLSGLTGLSSVNNVQTVGDEFAAYPNPFTQSSTITVNVGQGGMAEIYVVNLLGQHVAQVFDGELTQGNHSFTWNANAMPPGMYECILRMNGQAEEIPMMLTQ